MPCSIDLSNSFGGDPPQGIRAFLCSRLTIVNPRWHTSIEAIRVSGNLLKIQPGSLLENGGEDIVGHIFNGRWHAVNFW